jgi:hypothetical protein
MHKHLTAKNGYIQYILIHGAHLCFRAI